jgi:glycosyltransferase involved in cell wall biosynthesis
MSKVYTVISGKGGVGKTTISANLGICLAQMHKKTVVVDADLAMGGIAIKRELGMPFAFHVHSTEKGRTMGNGSEVVSNIELRAAQTADIVVTVSNAMRDELIGLGFPAEKIRVVYNGVDPQKYSLSEVSKEKVAETRAKYGVKDDDLMIFILGQTGLD